MNQPMTFLALTILAGIGLTAFAPWLQRNLPRYAAPLLALFPLAVFVQLGLAVPSLATGEVWTVSRPWIPSLGLSLTFTLDGLGLLMALLISGIGALVIIYGGAYLHDHPFLDRFYGLILLFMTAMLGVVLSGNAILLFVFWELTSISSFLLIGFEHNKPNARAAAWQALLVTGTGGLAMLAGFALLGQISGSFEIARWIALSGDIQGHSLAPAAFVLILLGAMTKSAQFPFHFWLPNAMEAPTPVSAYLHSATMVKAGIYLLARLFPVLGGLALWPILLTGVGLITLVGGSLLALGQHDLKRLLAYTTVAALGALTLFLGLGTPLALKTAALFLAAHALYKGALFLVAGGVDHAVHSRDINELGGLGRAMPYTAAAAGLAALSMAGIPPLLGFVAKELVYEATLEAPLALWITALVLIANAAMSGVAGWVGLLPFWGKSICSPRPHEGSAGLWLPPLLLACLGGLLGLFPQWIGAWLVAPAAQAMLQAPLKVKLALWHGLTPMLGLSVLTLLLGGLLVALQRPLQARLAKFWHALAPAGPAMAYPRLMHGVTSFSSWQTRLLQNGYLRLYVMTIVLFTLAVAGLTFMLRDGVFMMGQWSPPRFYDVILVGIILAATFLVTRSRSRLATIALLGSVGFSISILFLLYSAPDLAMVQFAIETLIVILFVLAIYRLPKFSNLSGRLVKGIDALVAVAAGALMTVLMLLVSAHDAKSALGPYFAENSLPLAKGRNIVNVILVDFRGFDTLGEITVLAIASIGVFTLIRMAADSLHQSPTPAASTRPEKQRSILLPVATRYLMPLILIFSIFLLLRGHNEIGGGFVGGLVAASALMLYGIAISPQALRNLLPVEPRLLVGLGLLAALVGGTIPMWHGQPFMTGQWLQAELPVIGKVGTPLLFDLGVYLVVIGVVLWILLTLAEE